MVGIPESPKSESAPSANPLIGIEKRCPKCGANKKIDNFAICRSEKSGRQRYCRCCKSTMDKQWNLLHPGYHRNYYQVKRKHSVVFRVKSRKANARRRSTPMGKLGENISRAINFSLKNGSKGRHWENVVGFSIEQLMKHLERLFKPGMTWDNHGTVWHVDHKIPKSAFNFETTKDIDFKRCWALKNLQPLWAGDNISKSNKLSSPFQPSLRI